MTFEEKQDQDAKRVVDLFVRVFNKLKKQMSGINNDEILELATRLAVAELSSNGVGKELMK